MREFKKSKNIFEKKQKNACLMFLNLVQRIIERR
nr:MAG TPA: hypothetical protein [Caudoviricetes sp.]